MGKPRTQGNGQIVPRSNGAGEVQRAPGDDLRALIKRMMPQLAMALPKHVNPERLSRIAMTAITTNPKLAECHQGSFIACLLTAAQLGLEPNTPLGQGYLIPRWDKRARALLCTWQTGYQGYIDLAYRSGMVNGIAAEVVRQGDKFYWCKGLTPKLEHEPSDDADREDRPITHAYAVVRIKGADPHFEVLSFAQIEKRRLMNDAEKDGKFSPWKLHYAEMAKKTAIKAALKYAPKSTEMQRSESLEDASERGQLEVVVDDRVAAALASEGLTITDVIDAPQTGAQEDPSVAEWAQRAGVSVEEAAKLIDQGYELTDDDEIVPPPGANG